jgi:hypothetical protein
MIGAGRRLAIPLTLLAMTLGAASCGGDEEDTTSVPSISVSTAEVPSVPSVRTTTTPLPATTTTRTTTQSGAKKPSAAPDSPANDVPPPPGSPDEAFERQCAQDPAACG